MRGATASGPPLVLVLSALLLVAGCGGDAAEASSKGVSAETSRRAIAEQRTSDIDARAPDAAGSDFSATTESAADVRPAGRQEAPVLTEPPDACELLNREDATELLGAPVGPGRSADVSGLGNCAYRTQAAEQLSLVVQLGADDGVESTQFAMSFEHCDTEVAVRLEDLGAGAALFERPAEPCGRGFTLWVATGLGFEGRTHPDLVRPVRGKIHLTLSRDPAADAASALPALRQAADRVLARLGR